MSELINFLTEYQDTDLNRMADGRLIIEAYNEQGEVIETYYGADSAISEYFEKKFGKHYPYSGFELIAEEFYGSYETALNEIKEDLK